MEAVYPMRLLPERKWVQLVSSRHKALSTASSMESTSLGPYSIRSHNFSHQRKKFSFQRANIFVDILMVPQPCWCQPVKGRGHLWRTGAIAQGNHRAKWQAPASASDAGAFEAGQNTPIKTPILVGFHGAIVNLENKNATCRRSHLYYNKVLYKVYLELKTSSCS